MFIELSIGDVAGLRNKHKSFSVLLLVGEKMSERSVDCKITYKHRRGDKILFSVSMSDLDERLLYIVPATYDTKTGECSCHFMPQKERLEAQSFEGKDRTCKHYPNGDCEIVTEEIIGLSEEK